MERRYLGQEEIKLRRRMGMAFVYIMNNICVVQPHCQLIRAYVVTYNEWPQHLRGNFCRFRKRQLDRFFLLYIQLSSRQFYCVGFPIIISKLGTWFIDGEYTSLCIYVYTCETNDFIDLVFQSNNISLCLQYAMRSLTSAYRSKPMAVPLKKGLLRYIQQRK